MSVPSSRTQDSPRNRIELFQKFWIARLRGRDQRGVESAVGPDRTGLVLLGKVPRQPRYQRLGLVGIRGQHADDVLYRYRVMLGMPAIEIGYHGHRGVTYF